MLFQFLLFSLWSLSLSQENNEATYYKAYYENGVLKEEGWKSKEDKVGYWFFYHQNGNIAAQGHYFQNQKDGYWYFYTSDRRTIKEGHFERNNAEKWWIIYDIAAPVNTGVVRKYQFRNGKKNGFGLLYKDNELFKAEKYIDNEKIGEWTDIYSFKKDNPNASL